MGEAFRLGGWGMYPTTIIGFVLLAAAVQYMRHPDRRRALVLRHLNVLVGLSALMGFTAGTINSFTHVEADKTYYAIIGVGESLNNVGLGLGFLILARIITALGAGRGPRPAAGPGDGGPRPASATAMDPPGAPGPRAAPGATRPPPR